MTPVAAPTATVPYMAAPSGKTGQDWHNLAAHVAGRRKELRLTQAEVHALGGPSTATMRYIEGALKDSYKPHVLRKLEHGMLWAQGSAERCLAGGHPIVFPGDDPGFSTPEQLAAALNAAAEVAEASGDFDEYVPVILRAIARKFMTARP